MSFNSSPWFLGAIKTVLQQLIPELDKRYHSSTTVIPKANDSESITMDTDGTLHVGGRLGQFENGGIYYPPDISPGTIEANAFLVTEGSGTFLGKRSMAVTCGLQHNSGVTLEANSKQITLTNTYDNRFLASYMLYGIVAVDEATAKDNFAEVTAVKQGGADLNITTTQTGNITLTISKALSTTKLTSLRFFPRGAGFSNLLVGAAYNGGNGYSLVVGQGIGNNSNASCVVGRFSNNQGNSSALFGRQHINNKQNAALMGQGHKAIGSAAINGVAAVGNFSNITATTAFAVGGGTSDTARKNLFEVDTSGNIIINGTDSSGNAAKFSISVVNGNLTATKI